MDFLRSTLVEWSESKPMLYATASILLVVIVGSLIGWLMDLAGQHLGVNTDKVEHHREQV